MLCPQKNVINEFKAEKDRIRELMNKSDIIIENFKPGTFEELLGPIPEHVIVCSISVFATGQEKMVRI